MAKNQAKGKDWDSDENEAQNNFFSWGQPGDKIVGTLISKKQVPSTLADKKGELQWVYEIKVREGEFHPMVDGEPSDELITLKEGEIINVGGRKFYDSRMARIEIGQIVGLKYIEDLKPKQKGYNPTKVVKVYAPKGDDGEYEKDEEFLATRDELAEQFDK